MAELFGAELYEAQNNARSVPRRAEGGASASPDAYDEYLASYHGMSAPLTREQWAARNEPVLTEPALPLSAADFCAEAARLVGGPRATAHGDKTLNFRNIAELWNGYWRIKCRVEGERLVTPFTAHDVGCMMELMKIARRFSGAFNADDYIDAAGYAGCTGEIAANDESLRKARPTHTD